ncbi:MAG: phosphoribosylaminoimidazolesuccinocarboxamide synthase [Firmicutes bacterium]|nr:phosphoribosylaminoimidazolesuccinocarboxamide synthase [Bacillota bacterium]
MELIKKGKTKDVYALNDGNILLKFKDDVTGNATTGEQDPGGNQVVGQVEGVGMHALKVTSYYFELLNKKGISTHFVSSDLDKGEMIVRPATMFGNGLEFVVRYVATGSFIRRFGQYIKDETSLNPEIMEVTLKDDSRNDPPLTKEILASLNLLTFKQFKKIEKEVKKVCGVVKCDLAKRGITLYDIKVEYGIVDNKIALIDEISGGNLRAYKNGKKLTYLELSQEMFG